VGPLVAQEGRLLSLGSEALTVNRRPLVVLALSLAVLAVARADDNPLGKSKLGEWIIQKTVISGTMTVGTYMFVSKIDGKKVTIVTQPLKEDMKTPAGPAQVRQPVDTEKPLPALKDDKKVGEEEIELKGKKLKCKKTENTSESKTTTTTWSSSEVPIYGIVRQIAKDKDGKEILRSDLVDYGTEGAKEKPLTDDKKTEKGEKSEKDSKSEKDPKTEKK
jgi:hypothetical protein